MKIAAIVPAAGSGDRFKVFSQRWGKVKKPFVSLANKPILIHTLKTLESSLLIDYILVMVHIDDIERTRQIIQKYRLRKVKGILSGGLTRTQSVYNGLKKIDNDTDIVVIHDGVRPFITEDCIGAVIRGAQRYGASVCGINAISTIKEVDKALFVKVTLNRQRLYNIQTPQAFKRDIILKAYKEAMRKDYEATDDSALVERIGCKVRVVQGSNYNIKLTTQEDLVLAEAIYAHRNRLRYP